MSVFLFSVANCLFRTASVLIASVCLCRLEAFGFLSCCLLPFLPTCVSWPFFHAWRVVPLAWRFFVWRVGPHGCLPSGPPFSKHSQSSLEFLFMGGELWEVCLIANNWHLPSILIISYRQVKHLEVRQKYTAACRIFNSPLSVSFGDETLLFMLDILHGTLRFLFLSHLLYGICMKIFIMNRYILKSYTTTKNTID